MAQSNERRRICARQLCRGRYIFEKTEPSYYQYAVELLNTRNKHEKKDFLSFLEEMDIDVISVYAGRAYLRKKNDGTNFAVYSDIDARIKQYRNGHGIWIKVSSSQFALSVFFLFYAMQYVSRTSALFYVVLAISGLYFLSGILLITLLGSPYRKKIKRLKEERKISE